MSVSPGARSLAPSLSVSSFQVLTCPLGSPVWLGRGGAGRLVAPHGHSLFMCCPPPFLSFGASASSGLSGLGKKKNLGGMWAGELAGNWSLVPSAGHTQRFPLDPHKLGFEEIQPPPGFLPSGVLSWKKEAFAGPETPDPQPGQQSQPYCPCLFCGQGIAPMPAAKATL